MASSDSKPSDLLFHTPEKSYSVPKSPPPSNQISASWSTKTPKKLPQPPRAAQYRRSGRIGKLPDELEILSILFNGLEASLKLLRMRRSMPYFGTLRAMVECMTDRRLTYGHLAQMKFLLPEEITIKRVLLPDEETSCMKYDLHVTVYPHVASGDRKRKQGADSSGLRDAFRMRIVEYHRANPKGPGIPEAVLPEPFNQSKRKENDASSSVLHQAAPSAGALAELPISRACHISQSFRQHFSKKPQVFLHSPSKYACDSSYGPSEPCHGKDPFNAATASSPCPTNDPSDYTSTGVDLVAVADSFMLEASQKPTARSRIGTSAGEVYATEVDDEGTPVQLSTPKKQFASTASGLQRPMMSLKSPDEDSACSSKFVRRPSCARSLQFDSPVKKACIALEVDDSKDAEILDILPADLLQSLKEKERKKEEQDMRRRVIKSLPKLFDRIRYLFQYIKTSFIKRQALIHELTTRHSDIVDESEIERQLELLQEILPDWICEKPSPSSTLLCINRKLSPTILLARLEEAV